MSPIFLSKLGLDQQADERAVKRAYAALLKSRRPDDDAGQFQHLHEIYQAALEYVRRRDASRLRPPAADGLGPPGWPLPGRSDDALGHPDPPGDAGTVNGEPDKPEQGSRADAEQIEVAFNPGEFFGMLQEIGQAPPAELQAWLHAHPALYSIQLRNQLVPALVHFLETAEELPTPEGLERLLAFFGLEQIQRRNMHLQPRLEQLRDLAFRQHQVIVGPDMSFMYQANGELKPRPATSSGWVPVVPILMILVFMSSLARCAGNADRSSFVIDRDAIPANVRYNLPQPPDDGKPWRTYEPPVPIPPAPAEPDPD